MSHTTLQSKLISDGKILVDIDDQTGEQIVSQSNIHTQTEEELIKIQFDNFAKQNVKPQFSNIARSYTVVIEAMYKALEHYFFGRSKSRLYYQELILSNKEFFLEVLHKAKTEYLPIRDAETKQKKGSEVKTSLWSIPMTQGFSENATLEDYTKNVMQPSYMSLDSKGETKFIKYYLETSQDIEFWYNNGTVSEQFFAVPYTDHNGEIGAFYPDFIVKYKDGTIGIFDPKDSLTLELPDAKEKLKGLMDYVEDQNKQGKKLVGGFIWPKENNFLISKTWDYDMQGTNNAWSVFSDSYLQGIDFSEYSQISTEYKEQLAQKQKELSNQLSVKQTELIEFKKEQEQYAELDFHAQSEIEADIRSIEMQLSEIDVLLNN
ncbi:MAG: hypothetical protein U9Q15_01935 [Patescibacteria group bacterium]|nr:hypothetical protein [Patescibacteria group bacterium]